VQTRAPKGTARERGTERDIGRMFKMLREEENIGIEKIDTLEGITRSQIDQ